MRRSGERFCFGRGGGVCGTSPAGACDAAGDAGVDYQMAHALALLAVAWLEGRLTGRGLWTTVAGWSFLAGTILFSGTLYVMALTGVTAIGAAVPVGGAAFLVGWAALFVCGLRKISGSTGE